MRPVLSPSIPLPDGYVWACSGGWRRAQWRDDRMRDMGAYACFGRALRAA